LSASLSVTSDAFVVVDELLALDDELDDELDDASTRVDDVVDDDDLTDVLLLFEPHAAKSNSANTPSMARRNCDTRHMKESLPSRNKSD
jgi:hypothetical protein